LVTTLPVYVTDVLHGGKEQIGLVMTSFLIAAVIFRPLAGKWLDDLGRKKLLVVALLMFLAASGLYFAVHGFIILVALRFLHGVSFGIGTTATGTIATDIIPDQRKGEGIGYYTLSINMAMVVGPFLGLTIVSHYGYNVLFTLFAITSLMAFGLGVITKTPEAASSLKEKKAGSFHWKSFIEPNAIPVSLVGITLSFAYSGILTFLPVFAKEEGLQSMASYFYIIYALAMIVSRPFTGRILDRLGSHVVVYPCVIIYVLGLICLGAAHTPFVFLLSAAIIGLGFGTLFPSLQTIAILQTPPHRRGLATGTYLLFYDTGIGLGSTILAMIAAASNYRAMYQMSAIVVFFAVVVYYFLHHRKEKLMQAAQRTAEL